MLLNLEEEEYLPLLLMGKDNKLRAKRLLIFATSISTGLDVRRNITTLQSGGRETVCEVMEGRRKNSVTIFESRMKGFAVCIPR